MKRLAPALLAALAAFTPARADVYVADKVGNAIYKHSAAGVRTSFDAGVNEPVGLALDAAGNLYSANYLSTGSADSYSATGVQAAYATGFQLTLGLAFDAAGNLYVANVDSASQAGSIVKVTPAGVKSTFAAGLARVRGLAFDAAGNLYAADLDSGNVYKYTPAGARSTFASGFNTLTKGRCPSPRPVRRADDHAVNPVEVQAGEPSGPCGGSPCYPYFMETRSELQTCGPWPRPGRPKPSE